MIKLDQSKVAEGGAYWKEYIPNMQLAVYVMCGGGFLGKFAAEQPADFYIDDRVSRLPYKRNEIIQAVKTLATLAKINGLDPKNMPAMPNSHSFGVF